MASVELQGVRKVYDTGHVAVADATFVVADGEMMVLVGPSGCGKSTLLRMIAGLEPISAGHICIDGRAVDQVAPKDRDIAMVFQSYALYPHLSVYDNLAFALRLRALPRDEIKQRVEAAAQMLELQTLLAAKPRQLSGGQRQRVALGRALVRQPKVFLLDEPLSNLDAKLRQSTRLEIARLHRRLGATMIYVTHDQIEAMTLGQRIVVMRDGCIQQIDTPAALYARPANRFVAGFLGAPGMNLFEGRLLNAPEPHVDVGGEHLRLSGVQLNMAGLAGHMGNAVVAGVRPEHLRPCTQGSPESVLDGCVDIVESIGSEVFVHFSCAGATAIARMPPRPLPLPNEAMSFACAPEHWHFFDAASGQRIDPAH